MRKFSAILVGPLLLSAVPHFSSAEKIRLEDAPGAQAKSAPLSDDNLSPEEKKKVVKQVADDYCKKGFHAIKIGQLALAKTFFEKSLILSPTNERAQRGLVHVNERLTSPIVRTRINPLPVKKNEPAKKNVRPPAKPALSPAESKERSNELYMRALTASQKGELDSAYKLCREALRFDPTNLQARRMADRLERRSNRP